MPFPDQPYGTPIPPKLNRWNWGAFLLNWIWGIGNNTWIALLMFVPLVNIVMLFVLGFKGSAWAWNNNLWRDEAHFLKNQRRWAIAGFFCAACILALIAYGGEKAVGFLKNTDVYQMAMSEISSNPAVLAAVGEPVDAGFWVTGNVNMDLMDGSGHAQLQIPLSGSEASGDAIVQAIRSDGKWLIELLIVKVDGYSEPIVVINTRNRPIPGSPREI